jgi:hypothetical protein
MSLQRRSFRLFRQLPLNSIIFAAVAGMMDANCWQLSILNYILIRDRVMRSTWFSDLALPDPLLPSLSPTDSDGLKEIGVGS